MLINNKAKQYANAKFLSKSDVQDPFKEQKYHFGTKKLSKYPAAILDLEKKYQACFNSQVVCAAWSWMVPSIDRPLSCLEDMDSASTKREVHI